MVEACGVEHPPRVSSSLSCSARRWPGIAGTLGGAFLVLYPTADAEILVFSLAVVVIGGRGSLAGAALGSLRSALLTRSGRSGFPSWPIS